jgi:hypothetical protein
MSTLWHAATVLTYISEPVSLDEGDLAIVILTGCVQLRGQPWSRTRVPDDRFCEGPSRPDTVNGCLVLRYAGTPTR